MIRLLPYQSARRRWLLTSIPLYRIGYFCLEKRLSLFSLFSLKLLSRFAEKYLSLVQCVCGSDNIHTSFTPLCSLWPAPHSFL